MKDLLISHVADIDGVSPVILMKLCKIDFDYELKDIYEVEEYFNELLETNLNIYNNIYIVDLTISDNIYKKINNSIYKEKFKVFDHHKTHIHAKEYKYVTLDLEECGSSIFYKYLNKKYKFKKNVKEYIEHVKNIDLWLWVEKNDKLAKELSDLFTIYGKTKYIDEIYKKLKTKRKFKLNKFENNILKLEQDKIDRYILKKEQDMIIIKYKNYKAGLIFNERYKSELGNTLSIKNPELDFIIMINLSGGISFRTNKDIDLSEIAESLGGGGHKKSCGAPIPNEYKEKLINEIFKGCEILGNKENYNG
ncbi:MAG: hypothetical protein J6K21_02820 [Bacilli bacterium]|nr:hypothetical protein [Bacilli bacterium]